MSKISVIIPTHNRPETLEKAIVSVLAQTYQDFEIIVVDDGLTCRADKIVKGFNNHKIFYFQHETEKGGSAARNTGIKNSRGEFVAFLDDDDEWLPEKLEIQMRQFENTPSDVGFCFSAVMNIYDDREEASRVSEGINNYLELALRRMKGFLTVTLIVKKKVFNKIGIFDESLPSHQDPDLIIRISREFKGLGINLPLVKVDMGQHEHIGSSPKRKIAGRQMILDKYFEEFKKRPKVLARHYFQLALWFRDSGEKKEARHYFKKAWQMNFRPLYLIHYLINIFMIFSNPHIKKNKSVWIIIVGCVVFNLLFALLVYQKYSSVGTDGVSYVLMAKSIAQGRGLEVFGKPHIFFSPMLSFFIVPFYWLSGNIELAGHLADIFFGIGSLLLLYYAMRMFLNRLPSLIGVIFLAFSKTWLWKYALYVAPQPAAGFFSILLLIILIKIARHKNPVNWGNYGYLFGSGIICGILYLTRPEYFFMILPVMIFIWLVSMKRATIKDRFLFIIVAFVGFCLLAAPYIAFLHMQTNQWIFSGRLNIEYMWTMQMQLPNDLGAADIVTPPSLPQNPILMFLKDLPSLAKVFVKYLLAIQQEFSSAFGILGFILFAFGLRYLVLNKKKIELGALVVMAIPIFLLVLRHDGSRGYIAPFVFWFVIFIAIGCVDIVSELADKLALSSLRRKLALIGLVFICAVYFIFPAWQLYFFLRSDFKPVEYQTLGQWIKANIPAPEKQIIVSRKPEIAFYADIGDWREMPTTEDTSVAKILKMMHEKDIKYLAVDSRTLGDLQQFSGLLNEKDIPADLILLKKVEFQGQKILFFELNT